MPTHEDLNIPTPDDKYSKHLERVTSRQREQVRASQDIGDIPQPEDLARKESCRFDLLAFIETYMLKDGQQPFGEAQRRVIRKVQDAILNGGQFCQSMPRGSVKTTIGEYSMVWAGLYGHRVWSMSISATAEKSKEMIESILTEFDSNAILLADFPEVIIPFRALDGIWHRCRGQRYQGVRTQISIGAKQIVFPTIPGSESSGYRITASGLSGGTVRGSRRKTADGKIIRPDYVFIDDPQTDASAKSGTQTKSRIDLVDGAISGLSGPTTKIAIVMACTVINEGDLSSYYLDVSARPEWRGERIPAMISMPDNLDLWDELGRIYRQCYETQDFQPANDFYIANRDAMDAGAEHYWPERIESGDVSAIQSTMLIYLFKRATFFAEYQNQPESEEQKTSKLDPKELIKRVNGHARRIVPREFDKLTAGIDCHDDLLYYVVTAWDTLSFSGAVVDYGTFPVQRRSYFVKREATPTLPEEAAKHGYTSKEGILGWGITELAGTLLGQLWRRDDGAEIGINLATVDAQYMRQTVYDAVRRSSFAARLIPLHGRGIGAKNKPLVMPGQKAKPGEILGRQWIVSAKPNEVRHVIVDSNHWKTTNATRWNVPVGDAGALTLFGSDPYKHEMFADHLSCETPVSVSTDERTVEEWTVAGFIDNHFWDCLIGSMVAASIEGVHLDGEQAIRMAPPRKRITSADTERINAMIRERSRR